MFKVETSGATVFLSGVFQTNGDPPKSCSWLRVSPGMRWWNAVVIEGRPEKNIKVYEVFQKNGKNVMCLMNPPAYQKYRSCQTLCVQVDEKFYWVESHRFEATKTVVINTGEVCPEFKLPEIVKLSELQPETFTNHLDIQGALAQKANNKKPTSGKNPVNGKIKTVVRAEEDDEGKKPKPVKRPREKLPNVRGLEATIAAETLVPVGA